MVINMAMITRRRPAMTPDVGRSLRHRREDGRSDSTLCTSLDGLVQYGFLGASLCNQRLDRVHDRGDMVETRL
jgi:hypothetical protein